MTIRVLVINQYYPPDVAATGKIVATICEALAEKGADVSAIVGQPSYVPGVSDAPVHEARSRLNIWRVPMGRLRGRQKFVVRFLGYWRFLYGAWRESHRHPRPDVVVTFHNPPLLGTLGALLAWRFGVPFVYVVQDIHPDILVRTGWQGLPPIVISTWRRLNLMALRRAGLVITLSDAMKSYLARSYAVAEERIVAIPLWGQPELDQLSRDDEAKRRARSRFRFNPGDLVVLYSGNMGVMHPVEILIRAAALVQSSSIELVLVGDGIKRASIEKLRQELSLSNVQLLPYQSPADFELLVQAADVCTVALQSGLEDLCLPSRSVTFMSAGRPVLAVMPDRAPLSRDLATAGAGWNSMTEEGVAAILLKLEAAPDRVRIAGKAASTLYRERYRRETLVARYVEAILGMA
jgi:glycosyltransferase involved in cell wall biosynthesis